jgi:hypothetical protein
MARIVVCGYMIRHPVAGNVLAYLHYLIGLHRLGHEVLYLEESGWPGSCYDPATRAYGDDPKPGLQIAQALLAEHGARATVCFVNRDSGRIWGVTWKELKRVLAAADLLLNLGGVCWLPEFRLGRRRALVDMDPFFTQVGRFGGPLLDEHHVHFTYGANIGRPGCTIPTADVDWRPTVPPVVSELWQNQLPAEGEEATDRPVTTVANWSAYGGVTYAGAHYGQKDEEFLRLLDLPRRTPQRLELALTGAGAEIRDRFVAAGWSVRDASGLSADMRTYQTYIAGSRGELSAAKHAYVATRSGWFSDRSVCYLAAGLPVIVQDTGFTDWLPADRGVLAFTSVEEAADCIARVNAAYTAHRQAAREIAEQVFSHRVVLPRLVDTALAPSGSPHAVSRPGGAP